MEGPENTDAWLRLNSLEFAPHRLHALLEAYGGDPAAFFAASQDEWAERLPLFNAKRLTHMAAVRGRDLSRDFAALEKSGAHLVTIRDAVYPANLRPLPDAPPVLFVRGELVPEDKFSLAIVGSRRATDYGLTLARQFARDLAAHGLAIASGGARGVDTRAHRGAMEGGAGLWPFWAAASTSTTPPRIAACSTRSPTAGAPSFLSSPWGRSRRRGTSPPGTA